MKINKKKYFNNNKRNIYLFVYILHNFIAMMSKEYKAFLSVLSTKTILNINKINFSFKYNSSLYTQ